uniref:F-box/LRR-repeat protein 15-like leucin rich repeat domain-containing protein n=1 Tax=Guillardia theta TaxID=55529 RepID=A0A7S4L0Q1_GUITH
MEQGRQRGAGCQSCPSLIHLCTCFISKNLHIIPSVDALPSHLLDSILEQRSNEAMVDQDLPFLLAVTFQTTPAERLGFLNFRSCLKITDPAMALAVSYCHALRRIDLSFSELVGNKTMESLACSCSLLESLSAVGCRQITDDGCTSIAGMKSLRELELELCNKITDMGIQSIARNRGSSLLTLNLGDLRQMSNISIQIIADHCVDLQSVSIAGSMQVMDLDVEDLCKRCTRLQSLNLRAWFVF